MQEIPWNLVLMAGGLVLTYAALRATIRRDQKAIAEKAEAAAKIAGQDKERLDSVIGDVKEIKTTEIPRIERLIAETSLMVHGLATTTTVQAANVDTLAEKVDDLRDLHKERQGRFDSLVDALLQQNKKGT